MSDFALEKWYMDAIDEKGRAFIGYSARLRWKSISLSYNNYTYLDTNGSLPEVKSSFSVKSFPEYSDDKLRWTFKNATVESNRIDPSFGQILLKDQNGEINWECSLPKALMKMQLGEKTVLSGLGYAEKIYISILPWKIPIEKLHWGRYLSQEDTIVWIRWEGPTEKNLVFHNGKIATVHLIDQNIVQFGDYTLQLQNSLPIRKGTVMQTVFSKFPAIAKLFPSVIKQLQENKWVSDGILKKSDKIISQSKAIHEFVVWK